MGLQFVAQPVGDDRAKNLAVDDHIEQRTRWLTGAFAHPPAGDDAVDRLEDAVAPPWPEHQGCCGQLCTVGEYPHPGPGNEPLRRDGADEAAKAVVIALAGELAAQTVGDRFGRKLIADIHRHSDSATAKILVVGP